MRVVIIDDHPLVIKGLYAILSVDKSIEIVGEASNVDGGIQIIRSKLPDIAIVDLKLGRRSGFDIVKELNAEGICKFIILTISADRNDFKNAEQAGVDGYVLKEAMPEELLYAIRLVYHGRRYYDPGLMEIAVSGNSDSVIERLTPREVDVLSALGQGLKNSEIAKKLFITEYTVKKHVSQILDKLGLADRTQAALYANNKGLVKYQ